jgi:hypothetical protein
MYINVLLNSEELIMKLRSNLLLKRTVTWRTTALKDRMIYYLTYMCRAINPRSGYRCCNQGWGTGNNVVIMHLLYHENKLLQNSCSMCHIYRTYASFQANFTILPCRSGLMNRGRNVCVLHTITVAINFC